MKILLASSFTQGQCPDDFCFVPDAEMVILTTVCGKDTDTNGNPIPDGICGCARSFKGIFSKTCTTTAVVADVSSGFEALARACHAQWEWTHEEFVAYIEELEPLLAPFAPNTHIGRRGNALYERHR